jgi:cell division septation protein DedD
MAGRSISRFALAALAASALLGACVKHVDEQAAASPPPPPPEQPALMGASTATPADTADAAATQAQANDDAYISSLPAGLMAVHKFDAASGRTILVISNYPVANPGLRARIWHARHHPTLNGGVDKSTPSITTASAAPAATAQPTPSTTPAPTTVAQAAPTPGETHSTPATQAAGFKGLTLSPGMWLIGGIALLAIIVLVMLAGRKQPRREPLRA